MNWITNKILKHKKVVLIVFCLLSIISVFSMSFVKTNYNMMDYLPEDSSSTVALNIMDDAFDKKPPNVRVLIENISIPEALLYKEKIEKVKGVKEVNWLDDSVNVKEPLDFIEKKELDSWYKDGNALFTVLVDENNLETPISGIREIIGDKGALSGTAVTTEYAEAATTKEISKIMAIVIPMIFLILIISTSSYFEPLLFMLTIGISILINSGTNIFLGEISFVTKATASVLQLAVSMDYSIFLLHRFSQFREDGLDVKNAMKEAMKSSFKSIVASGLTTMLGFLALMLMRFKIGSDMGIVLSKGIVFSLLSVMCLLPVLTIYTYKIIDKTKHKSFLPSFSGLSKFVMKIGKPMIILIAIIIIPTYMAQGNNNFNYGASAMAGSEETKVGQDDAKINKLYGKSNQMVLLVPSDKPAYEKSLVEELKAVDKVSSVTSYAATVGTEIPEQFIPEKTLEALVSKGYSRILLNLDTSEESDEAFKAVEDIRKIGEKYYGKNAYLAGGSSNVYDMRNVVTADNKIVTIASIVAIGLIILLIYRSLSLPILLLLTIEASIWINLSFPYFQGVSIAYIGFMVISSVQLGATVDYGILFANRYIENRESLGKFNAARQTVMDTTGSILTSACILTSAGFILGKISTNGVIGEIGILIGRGAVLSAILVLFFLPTLLMIFDKVIEKTTLKTSFYKGE